MNATIPDTLGELVALCCDDMDACHADDDFAFDMNMYTAMHEGKCFVCVAGSYMVKTLHVDINSILGYDEQDAMQAVDLVRNGCLAAAMRTFHADDRRLNQMLLSDIDHQELDTDDFNNRYHVAIAKMRARGRKIADEEIRLGLGP